MTKVTFYKHFASKDDVLESIREDMLGEMRDKLNITSEKSVRGGGDAILRLF